MKRSRYVCRTFDLKIYQEAIFMKTSTARKILALLLSAVLLIVCIPMAVFAEGEFQEENLLETKLDSASPILYYANSLGTADGSARVSAAWLSNMTDGDRNTATDVYAFSAGDYRWFGGQFSLTEESFVGRIDIYGDYENLPMYYNVYASDDLSSLYRNVNKTLILCNGTKQTVVVNKNIRYIAIIMQNALNADTTSRLKEIEVYSADPENTFRAVDLTNDAEKLVEAKPVKVQNGVAADDTNATNINTYLPYALTNLTATHKDWKMTSGYDMGVQFTFDNSYYIGRIDIDSAIYNANNTYDETWTIYASNDLSLLYDESSIVGEELVCTKAMGIQFEANVFAKYVALVNNYNGNMRVRAFRIHTADDTGIERPFEPSNVLRTGVSSSTGILMNASTEAVSDNSDRFTAEKIATVTDGNNADTVDVYGALDWDPARYVGAKFTLEDETIIRTVKVYSGASGLEETWRVYASDSEADLFAPQNLAGELECSGSPVEFTVNKSVSYIAFVCTAYNGNMRVAELEAWSAEEIEGFITENVLETHLASSKAIKLFADTGTVTDDSVFDTHGVLAYSVDGDTSTHHDISSPYSDPTQYFGGEYTLDDYYYIGNAIIYSGFDAIPDTVSVYASADIDTLYTAANKVATSLVCTDMPQTVQINKYIKYFAVVYETYGRAKEFQLWTADPEGVEKPEEPFASENVLLNEADHIVSSRCVQFYPTSHYVGDATKISAETIPLLTDGVTGTTYDCYSGLDWDPARYIGVEYTLDSDYYIGEFKIYSGYTTSVDTFDVYASDNIDTLYNAANCVATGVECNGTVQTINVGKNVRFVTFLISGVELYCARIAEFEAWTADPNASEAPTTSLSVLTIGNSYSENTSIYATEIALANGRELTFGYLKSPSCSIEKHYNAAINDIPGFKFQVTAPDGNGGVTKTTIKDGNGTTVDNPNAEHGATIDEALDYMDWDVIVFQQESSSSRSYETFAYLDELVDYVHTACPDAKLMFHEVWRWGEWDASDFANIKANAERAARENGLGIIASGLAFEYARELMDSATYPNEDDGHWQHANTQGQYLAGVAYVDTLFDIQCSESAFASHPYINADNNVAELTACANKAARYYKSYGDLDFDGSINAEDLATLVDVLIDKEDTEYDATLADVNNDGYINILDLIGLKKLIASVEA